MANGAISIGHYYETLYSIYSLQYEMKLIFTQATCDIGRLGYTIVAVPGHFHFYAPRRESM